MPYKKTAFYEVFTIIFGLVVLSISGLFLLNILYYLVLANFDFDTQKRPIVQMLSPRGEFVEVDGNLMHIYCSGEGDVATILEADENNWSIYWNVVQSEVSKFSKICSYDRLGRGWSEGNVQNDLENVETLHKLLSEANISGPYILAGHAWGAESMMRFGEQYPDEVKGLIFYNYPHLKEGALMNKYKNDEINYPLVMISSVISGLSPIQLEEQGNIRTKFNFYLEEWQEDSAFILIDNNDKEATLKVISSAIEVYDEM